MRLRFGQERRLDLLGYLVEAFRRFGMKAGIGVFDYLQPVSPRNDLIVEAEMTAHAI